eukprot:TRINITY_DN2201_c0_g1_i1.p1 TRINITY_DN2201_c0_g1~~TRINITY_DN2201_c0_g1_i1.p1  ORF type:complete len:408 (-),score=73.28 TRINITY_DN2201_c0_g1_i1:839-2062(-)
MFQANSLLHLRDAKGRAYYSIRFDTCSGDAMISAVCTWATGKYAREQPGFVAQPQNVSALRLKAIAFSAMEPEGVCFRGLKSDGRIQLHAKDNLIYIDVPLGTKDQFEMMIRTGIFAPSVDMEFPSKRLLQHTLSISAADAAETGTFTKIAHGGAAFVCGDAVRQIVSEVMLKQQAVLIADPGVPRYVQDRVDAVFDQMRRDGKFDDSVTAARENAARVDEALRFGAHLTGLNPADFGPITIMWDVVDILRNVTDSRTANEAIRTHFARQTNRDKLKASVSAGVGPFSAKVGYEKEMTQENVDSGYFSDEAEFREFKQRNYTAVGRVPQITPRGLDLMERQTFLSFFTNNIIVVGYFPRNATNVTQTQAKCATTTPAACAFFVFRQLFFWFHVFGHLFRPVFLVRFD